MTAILLGPGGQIDVSDREERLLGRVVIAETQAVTLTGRLGERKPADGYRLWLDTEDAAHIYVLEAPEGSASGDAVFRGIRYPKTATGNLVGQIEENAGGTLTFDNRDSDGGWS